MFQWTHVYFEPFCVTIAYYLRQFVRIMTTPARPRCFPQDGTIHPFDAAVEIPKHLSILVTKYPPAASTFEPTEAEPDRDYDQSDLGLFAGPISIAYTLFALSPDYPDLIEGKGLLDWAKAYLEIGKQRLDKTQGWEKPITSKQCGIIDGKLCYWAVAAVLLQGRIVCP